MTLPFHSNKSSTRRNLSSLACPLAALAFALIAGIGAPGCADSSSTGVLPVLHVSGNHLANSQGRTIVLRGVDIPSMEWSVNGDHMLQSVQEATTSWNARIIRVPLSQDYWLGKAPAQTDGGAAYRALVAEVVQTAAKNGAYTLLDLHWSDRNIWNVDVGQHKMPDEHSLLFWKSLAAAYANNSDVFFDLYNEPHDVSPDIWRNGGETSDSRANGVAPVTYQAVGLQTLLDAIRATGAKNVVVAGTLDWAYSTKDVLNGYALSDPAGRGIVYANHAYPFKGEGVLDWEHRMQQFAAKYPVIVSEFGSDPDGGQGMTGAEWVQAVVGAIQANHWNYTAWCFHPQASPCLLADWNYTPTQHFGVFIKAALAGHKYPDPAANSTSTSFQSRCKRNNCVAATPPQ